jgi:hypothetical protein
MLGTFDVGGATDSKLYMDENLTYSVTHIEFSKDEIRDFDENKKQLVLGYEYSKQNVIDIGDDGQEYTIEVTKEVKLICDLSNLTESERGDFITNLIACYNGTDSYYINWGVGNDPEVLTATPSKIALRFGAGTQLLINTP